jgi:hypothetical protein
MTMRAWAALLVSLATNCASGAVAQEPDRSESGADLGRFDRPYAPATPPTPQSAGASKDFRIIVTLPAYGTNNAIGSAADASGQAGPPDGHVTPDLLLRWLHQLSFVRLSASVDASVDRFFIRTDQNTDSLYGTFKAAFTDGKSNLFVPYVAYAGTPDFGPGITQWDDTLHSFYLGFTSGIGIGADGRVIGFQDATNPGDWSVSLDASVGRRLANPSDFANGFAIVSVDIVYNAGADLRFGITPTVRVRDYGNYFGSPRHDLRLGWLARAEWTPDWLTRINPGAELDFTVSFLRNRSSLASANYSQWEGGPALVLSWKF